MRPAMLITVWLGVLAGCLAAWALFVAWAAQL